MSVASLDDFMALNDQIIALVQADVPIELNLGRSKANTLDVLTRINAAVARRVGQGMSISEALELENELVSPSYRSLMRLSLESGDLSAGLVEAGRAAEPTEELWNSVQLSSYYPLILCGLAFLGLIGASIYLTPRLDRLYHDLRMAPGFGLSILQLLSSTLPYWVVLVPVAVVLTLLLLRLRSKQSASAGWSESALGWLPGASRIVYHQRCANFSESLARLLEAGRPLDEGLRVAAGAWNSQAMEEHFRGLAATAASRDELPEHRWLAARLPPFLQWALWHSEPTIQRSRALGMAAQLYRDSARRRVSRIRLAAPAVVCAVVGGGITLLYGLTLFIPLVDLLKKIAA
jgi:type II secretory pathway component PulF